MPILPTAEQRASDLCADIAACWRAWGMRLKKAMLMSLESTALGRFEPLPGGDRQRQARMAKRLIQCRSIEVSLS